MRFIRRGLVAILVIVFIVIFGEIALANAIKRDGPLIQSPIKITEALKDISDNPSFPENGNSVPFNPTSLEENSINEFAWRAFIALNWPVDCQGKRLSAIDPQSGQNSPKLMGQAPENPRAWELYPSPKDVFLEKGATPPSLDQLPEVDRCLNDLAGSEIEYKQSLRITETGEEVGEQEFSDVKTARSQNLLDGYGELKPEFSLKDIDAANQIPLVERQGNYVVNEIRLNPIEYNQILKEKWYDATELDKLVKSNKQFQFLCSKGIETTTNRTFCDQYEAEGAMEIKAVWRVFDQRNSAEEKAKYYTRTRKIAGKKGEVLQQAELGLIGFHIMQKTSSLGWIWSTFEHIDNAPSCANHETGLYTLYNNECKTGKCQENTPYVKPPYFWDISDGEPKAVTLEEIAIKDQTPSQICRVNSISTSAREQNQKWQERLRASAESSVWQHYQLIGTQWLQNPGIPYSNTPGNRRTIIRASIPLTNTALEPYAQGVSCIVCHTAARLPIQGKFCKLNGEPKNCADFSFLMGHAKFSEPIPVKTP